MELAAPHKRLLKVYGAAWCIARPFLEKHKRLKVGLMERLVPSNWSRKSDVWVQAASGGEAYLAWEMLRNLPDMDMRILLTSCTLQGVEVLDKAVVWCRENKPNLDIRTTYFPFDQPKRMRKAVKQASPSVMVLLETELWPGLMAACREQDVPVLVVNGRMNTGSLAGYLFTEGFWKAVGPRRVLAMDENDANRFGLLFGEDCVERMANIKFDRVRSDAEVTDNPLLDTVIKSGSSLLTLGSVREEEEGHVLDLIKRMREARPKTSIALCPRHMERVPAWEAMLRREGVDFVLRNKLTEPAAPGSVILWNAFGELDSVYALSRGVFVGGSLAPLGGQNFLEPLAHGVVPVIGPSYSNFNWAAGLVDAGLVSVADNVDGVFDELVKLLKRPTPQDKVKARYAKWLKDHQGGSKVAADAVMKFVK